MRYIAPEAACVEIAQTDSIVRRRSIGFLNISKTATPLASSFSLFSASSISAISRSAASWSGLSQTSAACAWSRFPFNSNHLGDSGMKNRPTVMIRGTTKIRPRGIRYALRSGLLEVKLSTMAPIKLPIEVQNW